MSFEEFAMFKNINTNYIQITKVTHFLEQGTTLCQPVSVIPSG